MPDALARGARGGGITAGGQVVRLAIQMVSIVTLSRLLTPDDFGLVAMVTAFVALGELIRDFGTSVVGLRRRELGHQEASNLFWLSVALGTLSSSCLLAITPFLVTLYGDDRVGVIMPALAVTVLFNAASAQFQVQLARLMQFARIAIADLSAQALGLGVAIVGALLGWQYWALVAQALTTALVGLLLRCFLARWMPKLPRRLPGNRAMFTESFTFGFAQLLTYVSTNVDTVVIGARWDPASLGGYTRAYQLLTLPLNSIIGPLTQVVLPTVNRARDEGRTIDSVLTRVQFGLSLPIIWVYAMTAAIADWLIPFVLGPAWREAVVIFQILAAGGIVWTFSRVSYWAFVSAGLGRQLVYYNIVTKTLATLLIVVASSVSIEAIACAVSVGLILSWPVNLVWLAKAAGQRSWLYWWNGILFVAAAIVGFGAAWGTKNLLAVWPPASAAIAGVLMGTLLYLAVIATPRSGRAGLLAMARLARRVARYRHW